MIKKWVQFLFGLNGASVIRGLRLGWPEFVNGCFVSWRAVHPLQNRSEIRHQQELKAIPIVTLNEILGSRKAAIKLQVQKYEDGMMPTHEVMALLSILATEAPLEVLEIGTFMGHTTKAMAENLSEAIIHTADLPSDFSIDAEIAGGSSKDDFHLIKRRIVGREFKGQAVEARIRQHFGDTATIDFKEFGQPSFFFIDGSHTYEYCKQDSEKCYAACGGVGVFLWHDCDIGHPGVLKFILEWRKLKRNITRIEGTSLAYWKST